MATYTGYTFDNMSRLGLDNCCVAQDTIQDVAAWRVLPAGSVITKGESLFPRLAEESAE